MLRGIQVPPVRYKFSPSLRFTCNIEENENFVKIYAYKQYPKILSKRKDLPANRPSQRISVTA